MNGETMRFKSAILIIGDKGFRVTDVVITFYKPVWHELDFDDIHMGMMVDDLEVKP